MVAANQCELVGLNLQPAGEKSKESTVKPVRATLTVKGRYIHIRSLLATINRAPRLYAVTQFSLKSAGPAKPSELPDGRLNADIIIERYVAPPEVTPSATPAGSS
jgi:hypothetical protein